MVGVAAVEGLGIRSSRMTLAEYGVDPRQRLRPDTLLSLAADVEDAYAARPQDESAIRALSVLRWEQGRRDEAWRLVCDALEDHPDSLRLRNVLARMQADSGDLDGATDNWRYVLSVQPESDEARFLWGLSLIAAKRYRQAVGVLPRSVQDREYRKPVALLYISALVGIIGGPVSAIIFVPISIAGLVLLFTGRPVLGVPLASCSAIGIFVSGVLSRDRSVMKTGLFLTAVLLVSLTFFALVASALGNMR